MIRNTSTCRQSAWSPGCTELTSSQPQQEYFDQKEDTIVICLDASLSLESYLMIAVNPKGRVSAGAAKAGDVWSGKRKMDLSLPAEVSREPRPDHWKIELRLPLSALGLAGDAAERIIGLGLIRVRNAGQKKPEITMWGRGLVPMLASDFGLAQFE